MKRRVKKEACVQRSEDCSNVQQYMMINKIKVTQKRQRQIRQININMANSMVHPQI